MKIAQMKKDLEKLNFKELQAEQVLQEQFGAIGNGLEADYVGGLCNSLRLELRDDFRRYWAEVNTEGKDFMTWYFHKKKSYYSSNFERNFLRLLTAHLFIRHVYGGRK